MRITDTRTTYRMEFDTFSEMVEHAAHAACYVPTDERSSHRTRNTDFMGSDTFEQAYDLACRGWEEGLVKCARISDPIVDTVSSLIERVDFVYDMEGIGIDIGKYLDDDPECWLKPEKQITEGASQRILKMVINVGAHGGIDPETIIAKGALLVSLIQLLELAGNRLEIFTDSSVTDRQGHAIEILTRIKTPDQPLDLARLMFAAAHPSMLRRMMWSCRETAPRKHWERISGNYGYPASCDHPADIRTSELQLDHLDYNNVDVLRNWLIQSLKRYGVHFRTE